MEQELIYTFEDFVGTGACAIMFFTVFVVVGVVIYIVCYVLWLLHIYATIRRRYLEETWWADYDRDIEEMSNE